MGESTDDQGLFSFGRSWDIFFTAFLAGFTIFSMALIWNILDYSIIFASFGSSAFIVYVDPRDEQASVHNILGAYPLAGFFGYSAIEYLMPHLGFGTSLDYAIAGALAVGFTIVAMLVTGFRHAPAAGAALAFVLKPTDVGAVFFLIGGGITLLIISKILAFVITEGYLLEEAVLHTFKPVKKNQ